jgi:RNA polymerase sigma-70 factor (ECF subfamily)
MDAERGLMERVARGDQGAFNDLAQRYSGKLLAVAGRLLGSRADAEDAVQRAFLNCYLKSGSYDARWQVSTWLYRVLTNVCVDELRRRKGAGFAVDAPEAGQIVEKPGQHLDLRRALEKVPTEARLLLALRYVDGLSYGELAKIRGISINTVKSQLARGKSILRKALQ